MCKFTCFPLFYFVLLFCRKDFTVLPSLVSDFLSTCPGKSTGMTRMWHHAWHIWMLFRFFLKKMLDWKWLFLCFHFSIFSYTSISVAQIIFLKTWWKMLAVCLPTQRVVNAVSWKQPLQMGRLASVPFFADSKHSDSDRCDFALRKDCHHIWHYRFRVGWPSSVLINSSTAGDLDMQLYVFMNYDIIMDYDVTKCFFTPSEHSCLFFPE